MRAVAGNGEGPIRQRLLRRPPQAGRQRSERRGTCHQRAAKGLSKLKSGAGRRSGRLPQPPSNSAKSLKTRSKCTDPSLAHRSLSEENDLDGNKSNDRLLKQVTRSYRSGISHLPDAAERKIASIAAILPRAFSRVTGTSAPSNTAVAKASPCRVY